ncbi:MAG TPA: phosphatase PAP2 family protein [Acidobacteriota bacterium]|jgi:membrane-associated phospholipid phosphatase|nr:phosphatase PAP2 family protein [Acidobacteriota bacterium]
MPKRVSLLVLIFSCNFALVLGETHSGKDFFPHFYHQQKEIWSFPAQKKTWQNETFWLLIGCSTASFSLDGSPARELREDPSFSGFNSVFASSTGDVVIGAVPLAFLLTGEISRNPEFRDFGWKSCEAALDALLVTSVWKLATQRSRPHTGENYGFWKGGNSFPSGHSTFAWALAATTASHFKQHKWLPWIVYPVAGVVSFSRITSGNHFPSDAVAGSLLGFVIGRYVVE